MYVLAGRVAEVMGGASWEELLHQRIFQPLQMTDSRVIGYDVEVDATTSPCLMFSSGTNCIHPCEPAGAIASSADDMAKWLSWHLRGGVTSDGNIIINGTTLADMYKPHVILSAETLNTHYVFKPQFPHTYLTFGYGYAWTTSSYKGYSVVGHGGKIHSYASYLHLLRDLDLGIFISNNGPGQTPPNDEVIVHGCIKNPKDFLGVYRNRLFGDIVITQNQSSEMFVEYGHIKGKLHKTNDRHVLMMEFYGSLEFLSDLGMRYLNMTFTKADESGKYHELLLRYPTPLPPDTSIYSRIADCFVVSA
ncbi:hypothetical protein C0Q70_06331 [Pomacea canaliculata]|uniref:Beta-lactamase-related domain-containing protein n=1 Tax=Pomacea canaliculata TaxID=400727 RepID=A0A2T7PNP4_POMCA|nr:hypothetical protein C0Q70_06331 [Pomacea canaliculata]